MHFYSNASPSNGRWSGSSKEVPATTAFRALYGSILLLAPGLLPSLDHSRASRRELTLARLLGARHLVQAAMIARKPSRSHLVIGVLVDTAHAGSMVTLAVITPGRRWLCGADALVAANLAGAGMCAQHRLHQAR